MKKCTALLFWLLIFPSFVWPANYYVGKKGSDSNTRSQAQNPLTPWLTVNYGAGQLAAGDILIVQDGTYREAVKLMVNGTGTNPITIKAQHKNGAIVMGTTPVAGWTRCRSNDSGLTVGGVINVNYDHIYWAEINQADIADIYKATFFEKQTPLFIAQYPYQMGRTVEGLLQNSGYYITLSSESNGQTAYLADNDFLGLNAPVTPSAPAGLEAYPYNQPDGYWNGARLWIYSRGANNTLVNADVADFIRSDHKVVFSQALGYALQSGSDSYSFINHPHILSRSGEYFISPAPKNGKYRAYVWPLDTADLADNVAIATFSNGFYAYPVKNLIIDGFEVAGYASTGILARADGSAINEGVAVRNCYVHHNNGWGIFLQGANGCVVESCTVYMNYAKDGRGIHLTSPGRDNLIKDNVVMWNGSTDISYYDIKHSSIIGNYVNGAGTHGNGTSCYLSCDTILLAYNKYFAGPTGITLQDFGFIVAFGNLFYSPSADHQLNSWAKSQGYDVGPVISLQNTIIATNSSAPAAFDVETETYTSARQPVFSYNNILHGDNSGIDTDTSGQPGGRGNNLYTKYGWTQNAQYGWALKPGEIDGRAIDMNAIFSDTAGKNFTLQKGSLAIGKGRNLDSLTAAWRLKAMFPDFDFSKDMNGNSWKAAPSVGCYEYYPAEIRGPKETGRKSGPGKKYPNPLSWKNRGQLRGAGAMYVLDLFGRKIDIQKVARGGVSLLYTREGVKKIIILE